VTIRAGLLDDQGKAIGPATDLGWSTDHPQVATVTPAGEVIGVNPGRAVVTATAPWGKAATADVFVTGGLLVSSNRGGALGIYQLRTSAPDTLYPVLVDRASNRQAVLSPDRTRMALSSDRAGSYDLYVVDADGRNLRRLTVDAGAEGEPAWTPDGSRIVYTSTAMTGVSQIASIRADGSDPRPLTSSAGGNRSADVSPDGRTIAFVSVRDGNAEIYEMDLEGTNPRRVTKSSDRESNPHFLSSGDLVFATERKVLRILSGAPVPAVLLQTDQPIVAMDVSGDGERIAYVAGKLAEGGRGKNQLTLRLQAATRGSVPLMVPLRPGEQVLSPSF
jgi:Tol biopolymer transport system component